MNLFDIKKREDDVLSFMRRGSEWEWTDVDTRPCSRYKYH